MLIENNKPSAGCIRWSGLHIQFAGQSYTVADGYSNYIYAIWYLSNPTALVVSDDFPGTGSTPALTVNDCIVFLNKDGIAFTVPSSTILDGDLIVPGSILAQHLSANCITAGMISAGALEAGTLAVNNVGAVTIAARAIQSDMIGVGQVLAENINVDDLLADTAFIEKLKSKGIEITSGTSLIVIKLENGQVSIMDNNEAVAYFNDQLMHIRNAEILDSLRFGSTSLVKTTNGFCIK